MQTTGIAVETEEPVVIGGGDYRYRVDPFFARVPAGMTMIKVAAVAVDRHDNVYAFVRDGSAPIMIFDRKGDYVGSWGAGEFVRPHGLHISSDDHVYCTDDGNHVVRKYTLEGRLLLEIGIPGQPAQKYSCAPFNRCTHTALSPDHTAIYVSDGYGNSAVHKFTQQGKLLHSWGASGMDPGQFNLPHNVCCDDDGWVYVADRESHRVQVFDGNGHYESEWRYLHRPCGLAMNLAPGGLAYVGELGPTYAHMKGHPNTGPRVSVLSKDGTIVARLNNEPTAPPTYQFIIPHGVACDSQGDIYVADTQSWWADQFPGIPPMPGPGTLKKLIKQPAA